MANATKLPIFGSDITFFQWSTVTAPNPRLASPIDDDDTTLKFTSAPLDVDGTVVTEAFLMGVKNNDSYVETIYVPAGELSGDGLTATNVVRGIDLEGIDWTTSNSSNVAAHEQDSPIFCNITGVMEAIKFSALQGVVATGGSGFIIGTDALGQVTISRSTGTGTNVGWLRWNSTGTEVEFSDDGSSWTAINDTVSSPLVKVTATDTTPGYLDDKLTVGSSMTTTVVGGGGDEDLRLDTAYTTTVAEIDQLSGISANVTDTNLNTITAGSSSDASALHSHSSPTTSFTAGETVATDDAVALMANEVEYFSQLDDEGAGNDIALGDSNVRRRYAVKFTPKRTPNFTTMKIRGRDVASSTMSLTATIETDAAGEPSGTPVTNGTANVLDVTSWGATYADRTLTWGTAPVMVSGTDYWLVLEVSTTDAVNYIELATNDDFDENYLTFTRLTYNLDTVTWGGSVTNATPFFWTVSEVKSLGMALVPTDANFGGRTWSFVGFAKAGGAADVGIDVYTDTVPGLSGIAPGEDYYLSTTAGQVSTPVPNSRAGTDFAYKIGRGNTATLLQVETGNKEVWGQVTGTATTTTQFVTWFKPKLINITGGQDTSVVKLFSQGYYDGTSNYSAFSASAGVGTNHASQVDSFYKSVGGNGFYGRGSAITVAGATYVITKEGSGAEFGVNWRATA